MDYFKPLKMKNLPIAIIYNFGPLIVEVNQVAKFIYFHLTLNSRNSKLLPT